ncbi:MAG TPA: hypothetical protein VI011_19470 [Asanoa sp.]
MSDPRYGQPNGQRPAYGRQPAYGQQPPEHDQPPSYGQPRYGRPQYEQPRYDQPQYDQPQYDQPQYEQPRYDQPQYDQPQYDQPQYEQPRYDQPQYDQPQYGQVYGQPRPTYEQPPQYGQQPPAYEQQPPPYGQQPGYPAFGGPPQAPTPPAKKGMGKGVKILLGVLVAVLVLCVGGGTVAYFALKDDVGNAVDAAKTRVVAPDTLNGRPKLTTPALQAAADRISAAVDKSLPNSTSSATAFYGNPAKKDLVMIQARSGLVRDPAKALDDFMRGVTEGAGGAEVKSVDPGPLGGVAKCADVKSGGTQIGWCTWVDNGSLGTVGFFYKTVKEASAELVSIRNVVEKRG